MHARAIEAVTFDVGSTLLADPNREERREESRALKHWLRDHGVVEKHDRRRVLTAASRSWSDSDVGTSTIARKAAESIVESLGVRLVESERQRLRSLLTEMYEDGPYYAAEGVRAALERLQRQGVALGIVSNRGARPGRFMMRQLEANGLAEFFDPAAVVWSDEVGFSKPDPRIYLSCLGALDVAPEHAAHVGDVKAKDVAGARDLGMTTIRYTGIRDDDNDGPEADTVISDYAQLEEALGLRPASLARRKRGLLSALAGVLGPATYETLEAGTDVLGRLAQLCATVRVLW